MQAHTIEITIPDDLLKRLDGRARSSGTERGDFALKLIEKGLREETIDEILEPFRAGFKASGMTEDELTDLMDSELKAVRAERRASPASGKP